MTAAAGTQARMLEVARSQIGVRERPAGSNRVKFNTAFYGRTVSGSAYPWCAAFVWWCAQKAGIPTSIIPKTASTGINAWGMEDWFRAKGRYGRTPKVGALVVFTFSHIGIVEKKLSGGRIQTIEGNTDASGSRTGGQVMRKIRSGSIHGYCYPAYSASSATTASTGDSDMFKTRISLGSGAQTLTPNKWNTIHWSKVYSGKTKKGNPGICFGPASYSLGVRYVLSGFPKNVEYDVRIIETRKVKGKWKVVDIAAMTQPSSGVGDTYDTVVSLPGDYVSKGDRVWLQINPRKHKGVKLTSAYCKGVSS